MDPPPVRYVSTTDDVSIAYWAMGQGPAVVMLPALPHSHIRMEWEIPEWRTGFEIAARRRTVVRYDTRGTGLSQRPVGSYSHDALLADLDAVIGEVGREPVALYAFANSCPLAIAWAALHPERVSELILWFPIVDGSVHRSNAQLEAARRIVETDWLTFTETVAHGLHGWSESTAARRFAEVIRAGNDPETFLELVRVLHGLDVTELLPRIRSRTLILHRPASTFLPRATVERVAALIPGAQIVLLDGESPVPVVGDWRSVVRAIEVFLGGPGLGAPGSSGGRALRLLAMRSEALSVREQEVIGLLASGFTNREIAAQLCLSVKTVEKHVSRMLVKLDLRSRAQLAAYAARHGMGERSA